MARNDNDELKQLWEGTKAVASMAWRAFRRLPAGAQAAVWVGLIALVIIANVTAPSEDSKSGPQKPAAPSPNSSSSPAAEAKPELALVRGRSYCQQDFTLHNVDVVVALKNRGDADADSIAILPIRHYASGRSVHPIGDTMSDVKVPADGEVHTIFHSYGVGETELIDGCEVEVIADGYERSGDRQTIPVRHNG